MSRLTCVKSVGLNGIRMPIERGSYGAQDSTIAPELQESVKNAAPLTIGADAVRLVHGEQHLRFHRPLPVRGMLEVTNRVLSLTGLSVPYAPPSPAPPTEIFRKRLGEDFYMLRFHSDDAIPELERDPARTLALILDGQIDDHIARPRDDLFSLAFFNKSIEILGRVGNFSEIPLASKVNFVGRKEKPRLKPKVYNGFAI